MVKRQGALLLALLYVVTVAGFALNLHYCGNYVADVQINAPAKACDQPMGKGKMNCCKNGKLDVKVKDDHQKESTSFLSRLFVFELPRFAWADFLFPAHPQESESFADRGPPGLFSGGIAVFIKNCVFRI